MLRLTLLLFSLGTISAVDFFDLTKCIIDYRTLLDMWENKLTHDLKSCDYNVFDPPATNSTDPLKVSIRFVMKSFKLDGDLQEFTTYMWSVISWTDERLQWEPSKYDGIDRHVMSTGHIWAPGLKLINSVSDEYNDRFWFVPCDVTSVGEVRCVAPMVYWAKCATDLTDWPYDAQHCKMEFGLFHENGAKIQLDVGSSSRAVTMIAAGYGAEWDIMDFEQEVDMTSDKQLIFKFKLERHGAVLAVLLIYPSMILTTLTVISQFLDARQNIRLLLLGFSLMSHFDFITNLEVLIPDNTSNVPRLFLYYRGSFILTNILILQSVVLKFVCKRNVVCPDWITSVNDFVLLKFLKFVIWPRWDTTTDEDISGSNFVKDWTDFANIINSVCIVLTFVVYVSLYFVFIPQPIPFD